VKLLVTFSSKEGKRPIIAQVVRDTGVLVNVERAMIESNEGEALIDIPEESCRIVKDRLTELGAAVRILEDEILLDETECVDCGACISICPRRSSPSTGSSSSRWTRRDASSAGGASRSARTAPCRGRGNSDGPLVP